MIYLKFRIAGNLFAVPVNNISESIRYSAITKVPKLDKHILGVMNLRGKIVPVIDTRTRMGLTSLREERKAMIDQLKLREQEHINWVQTLENEVNQERKISVQRDPTLCNFGKWYIPYMKQLEETTQGKNNSDNVLTGLLRSFNEPHKKIHSVANDADEFMKAGDIKSAKKLIEQTKDTTLKLMVKLFGSLYDALESQSQRDIIVIAKIDSTKFGFTVDAIDSTFEIDELKEAPIPTELVQKMCIKADSAIQIMNLKALINSHKIAA